MDLNKISKTDLDHIEQIAMTFEAQYAKFNQDISDNSPLLIILKGHLYIEHELKIILKNNIAIPDRIKYINRYSDIMNLVFAIGALPTNLFVVINKINIIRNKFAHDLDYEFTESILAELEDCLDGDLKRTYVSRRDHLNNSVDKLRELLFWVWEYVITKRLIANEIANKLKTYNP